MVTIINILSLFVVFSLFIRGSYQQPCLNSDLVVTQKPTGKSVGGKPEYNVTITNKCVCTLSNVGLNCKGFRTTEPVPPEVLALSGDICRLNKDITIPGHGSFFEPFSFKYAWDVPFRFTAKSFNYGCS